MFFFGLLAKVAVDKTSSGFKSHIEESLQSPECEANPLVREDHEDKIRFTPLQEAHQIPPGREAIDPQGLNPKGKILGFMGVWDNHRVNEISVQLTEIPLEV